MSEPFPTVGRCLCGAVSVEVRRSPVRMAQCHCRDCQRVSGTGHATNAMFEAADVTVTGETRGHAVTADSGNTLTRHFCVTCGSRVFGKNSGRPGVVTVPAGIFDDSSWFTPQAVFFTSRRPGWDPALPDLPAFEAMPPAPPKG